MGDGQRGHMMTSTSPSGRTSRPCSARPGADAGRPPGRPRRTASSSRGRPPAPRPRSGPAGRTSPTLRTLAELGQATPEGGQPWACMASSVRSSSKTRKLASATAAPQRGCRRTCGRDRRSCRRPPCRGTPRRPPRSSAWPPAAGSRRVIPLARQRKVGPDAPPARRRTSSRCGRKPTATSSAIRERAVLAGRSPIAPSNTLRGARSSPRGALHERLDDDRRHLAAVLLQDALGLAQAGDRAAARLEPRGGQAG